MAQTVCVLLDDATMSQLAGIAGDRSRPLKHILRARIVLLSGKRLTVQEVARQAGVSRPAVWRWQQRFAEEGVEGLLRDKTRPPGTPPHSTRTVAEVLALTCFGAAGRGHPLDRARPGQARRDLLARRATDLGSAPPAAAPGAHVQAFARPGLRCKGRGCGGSLPGTTAMASDPSRRWRGKGRRRPPGAHPRLRSSEDGLMTERAAEAASDEFAPSSVKSGSSGR